MQTFLAVAFGGFASYIFDIDGDITVFLLVHTNTVYRLLCIDVEQLNIGVVL